MGRAAKMSDVSLFDFTRRSLPALAVATASVVCASIPALAQSATLTGSAAFGDWRADKPGLVRLIRPGDLPKPGATAFIRQCPHVVAAATLQPSHKCPAGFKVELLAEGLNGPREMRTAPNGDIFVAETRSGRIRVLRLLGRTAQSPPKTRFTRAGSTGPFGIAFFPSGPSAMGLRRQYRQRRSLSLRKRRYESRRQAGDRGRRAAERGGHSTRDIVFTKDGKRMLVSVGSAQQRRGRKPRQPLPTIRKLALGASWGDEARRADVLPSIRTERPENLCHRHPQLRGACRSSDHRRRSIARPTSATASATISSPTMSPACARAHSMAGRGSISATTKIRIMPASGRT